jgi:hypothetical protein
MAADLAGTRMSRRRRKRRRALVVAVGAAVLLVLAVVAGALVATGGSDGDERADSRGSTSTSTTSTSTTTTTVPVSTTVVPKSTNPVVALAQQYDGRYVGTFTNTTFNTTGAVSLELRVDPATGDLSTNADFDGDLFGGGAKEVRRISGMVKIGDPNAAITTETDAFGPVTGRIDEMLRLVLTADDVPGPKVKSFTLVGGLRADLTGFDATYTVTFADGATAEGTLGLSCDPAGARGNEVPTICALTRP